MVPGNLQAGLQTFEGGEVNEVNQKTTYTMQHNPSSILPELKKMLSFAYWRGMFADQKFDAANEYSVVIFLNDLLPEHLELVTSLPFVVEYCLMYPF